MLCRAYIEALLADEAQADRIWEAWQAGDVEVEVAYIAWILVAGFGCQQHESSARAFVGQERNRFADIDWQGNVRHIASDQFRPIDKL